MNLNNKFYEVKEMQDLMIQFYLNQKKNKKNL